MTPRKVRLFLFAVLFPSVLVVAVGMLLIARSRELALRRQEDARRSVVAAARQEILGALEQVKLQELALVAKNVATSAPYRDASVALVARIVKGEVVLPWRDDSAALAFARERDESAFSSSILSAQGSSASDRDSFMRARSHANSPSQKAYVDLLESHRLRGAARDRLLWELLNVSLAVRDEYGVPFALYAARALVNDGAADARVARLAEAATTQFFASRSLSPTACYLLHSLSKKATEDMYSRCAELDAAEQLAIDGLSLAGPRDGESAPHWSLWPAARWLVSSGSVGETRILVAVRAPVGVTTSAIGAEPLGAGFSGAYFRVPDGLDAGMGMSAERMFYIASIIVVVALATTSARLLWRDVRRDVLTARMRTQFVSGVTHELKTPVAAIRLYAETLREHPSAIQSSREEYLDTIIVESERLSRLLDNVLDFTRIEHGAKTYARASVSLASVVRQVARTMAHPIEQKGFTLSLSVTDTGAIVLGDRDALEQAVLNLLTNAIKYSGDQRAILVELAASDAEVSLSVTDYGIGIPDHEQGRIFDQFYRAPVLGELGIEGVGLGLTIVQHIAQAHGGRVSVESTVDAGSTFTLHLPRFRPMPSSADSNPSVNTHPTPAVQ